MKKLYNNKWLLKGIILIIMFSSIGSSLSVIAETLDYSTVETTNKMEGDRSSGSLNIDDEAKNNDTETILTDLSDPSLISESYDSDSEKEKNKGKTDVSDNSNRLHPEYGYPGEVLANSKSGDAIMYGEPNLYNTMQGEPSIDWWRTINHFVSRRVIENFVNDRLSSSSEFELGYRKGDTVTIPLNMGFWEGNKIFDKPSGINFTGQSNLSSGGFPGGGQPYFENIVPSMSGDRVKINDGNDYSIMIDAWDIPGRPNSWTTNYAFRSALSTNSTKPEHASLVPIFAQKNGRNVVSYNDGKDKYQVTFYADSSNSQWVKIERLNTKFEPDTKLPFEIYVSYYARYNTFNSTYQGNGKYNWRGASLSTETGKFTLKGDVKTKKPNNLSISQKSIPTYKIGQKITAEEIKKYVAWSGNHNASSVNILGDNLDYVVSDQDIGEKTLSFILKESLDDESRSINFNFKFNIEQNLNVEMKNADIILGTDTSIIDPKMFIKSVRLGNIELATQEYDAEFINAPETTIVGISQIKIKVSLKNSNKSIENVAKAKIIWGSTIISRANDTKEVDVSVSLLDNKGVPYLNANKGFGFSTYRGLLSRPNMSIFRETNQNGILSVSYGTIRNSPEKLAEIWNQSFDKVDLSYGDVVRYSVNDFGNAETNSKGKNTWISRNESLVRETQGYDDAYYEITTRGYRLMHINQLEVNSSNKVLLNTSKEEINKNIFNYISIPSHISNPQDYKMEFESVDTSSSGKKTSIIKAYQNLESGGDFMTTYSVNYTVNPEIEETSYDVEGNEIVETKRTSFDYGTQFKPSPTKYLEKDDNLYVYKGWLENEEEPGADVPKEGIPSPTEKESKFYYIYEKADKYINVTIPTEMVFGTFDNTKEVKSNKYEIKNNSKELTTGVTLNSFHSVNTSVKLLGENDEPDEKMDSAKLNLLVSDEPKIKGFNETKSDIALANIEPENKITIGINGEYHAKTLKTNIVEYNIKLKFKAISGN